jgi:hypothetical protein
MTGLSKTTKIVNTSVGITVDVQTLGQPQDLLNAQGPLKDLFYILLRQVRIAIRAKETFLSGQQGPLAVRMDGSASKSIGPLDTECGSYRL